MAQDLTQSESSVNSLVRQEHEALDQRSRSERLADSVASFAGSVAFIALHVVFVLGWVCANALRMPITHPFDPFPFTLLGVMVAVEAGLQHLAADSEVRELSQNAPIESISESLKDRLPKS